MHAIYNKSYLSLKIITYLYYLLPLLRVLKTPFSFFALFKLARTRSSSTPLLLLLLLLPLLHPLLLLLYLLLLYFKILLRLHALPLRLLSSYLPRLRLAHGREVRHAQLQREACKERLHADAYLLTQLSQHKRYKTILLLQHSTTQLH